MDNKSTRWNFAQEYEKDWWNNHANQIDFDFYKNYSFDLIEFSKDVISITKDTYILEVGSGAGGILTFLKTSENRYAIDPLEYYYSTVEHFVKQRDEKVKYFTGKGENLPYSSEMFDLIIMDNVLDHCDNPNAVMMEINRVTKPGGIIYFKQNTYHTWGRVIRLLMEMITFDKGHPHTFSKKYLKKLFSINKLEVLKTKRLGYLYTWRKEITAKSLKEKIKALLFVTRDRTFYLLEKK